MPRSSRRWIIIMAIGACLIASAVGIRRVVVDNRYSVLWSRPKRVYLTGEMTNAVRPLKNIIALNKLKDMGDMSIEIDKSDRILRLKAGSRIIKAYVIGLGRDPVSSKTIYGDNSTPEGNYYICGKNPRSAYYLSLKLSYPNAKDAKKGRQRGLIDDGTCSRICSAIRNRRTPPMDTRLGGNICIHGGGAGIVTRQNGAACVVVSDWTQGCIALSNPDIKELFDLLPTGTPVRIHQ